VASVISKAVARRRKHTHIGSFFPVPIPKVIDNRILPVTVVHLPSLGAQLIEFRPGHFGSFSVLVASTRDVRRGEEIHTIIFVVLNMDNRDEPAHFLDTRDHFRKVFKKPFHGMDRVATDNVVGKEVVAACKIPVGITRIISRADLFDSVGKRVVRIRKPSNKSA
jgi:hypothetical protein